MDDSELMEIHQERMCELCQDCVFGQRMNTNQYNLCEGSKCDEALDYLKDELIEQKRKTFKYLIII